MSWSKNYLRLGDGLVDSEFAFIVSSMLRSAAWGSALLVSFLVLVSALRGSDGMAAIEAVQFEMAYGSFYLGFGAAGVASIAKRLAYLASGVPLRHAGLRSVREAASPSLAAFSVAFACLLSLAAAVPFATLAAAFNAEALRTVEFFSVCTFLLSASAGALAFAFSAKSAAKPSLSRILAFVPKP